VVVVVIGDGKTWKCLKESYSSLVGIWMRIIIKIISAFIIPKKFISN
jgi:hypothetical protein